ncbi:LysR family transcriptional regulator [Streptomyces sp. NPDC004230]
MHLRCFVAVAEELNFSAAARRLHMATPPLSQRIRDLERELGQRLFERDTHSIALTPAGAALLPIARDVLDQFGSIPWRLRMATRVQRSTVLIGIPPGLNPELRARVSALADRVQGCSISSAGRATPRPWWRASARAGWRWRWPGCRSPIPPWT